VGRIDRKLIHRSAWKRLYEKWTGSGDPLL
jgi:hypothetical protein